MEGPAPLRPPGVGASDGVAPARARDTGGRGPKRPSRVAAAAWRGASPRCFWRRTPVRAPALLGAPGLRQRLGAVLRPPLVDRSDRVRPELAPETGPAMNPRQEGHHRPVTRSRVETVRRPGVGVAAETARGLMASVVRAANGRATKLGGRVDPAPRHPATEAKRELTATVDPVIDAGAEPALLLRAPPRCERWRPLPGRVEPVRAAAPWAPARVADDRAAAA